MVEQKIKKLITQITQNLGYELIEIKFLKSCIYKITIFIDGNNGININDCSTVIKYINASLKKNTDINYNLEVSSPGPQRPLLNISHYKRFIGKTVRLILYMPVNNNLIWQGLIESVKNNIIAISIDSNNHLFVLSNIKKANLVPLL